MSFNEILNQISNADIPGVEILRAQMPVWVMQTRPYGLYYLDCLQYIKEHLN